MDFLSRLVGGSLTPKQPVKAKPNDPQSRLVRFRRIWEIVLRICNKPRGNRAPEAESADLNQLKSCLDSIAKQLRDETRAPVPHSCLQYAASAQIYAVIGRAAAVSHHEQVVMAAVGVFAALVDSEEEDFLSNITFAKSLMRLVKSAVDDGQTFIGADTETAVMELLFTISAKIRLQPETLPCWFAQRTVKMESEDDSLREKEKSFVGQTQREDFPLCYLLIDRVHHEGRIGDFARTGLLYVFEATGRSEELEEWIVSSDLPTLMASGLGALYSQLSRELSILHPDATLPPVLAMSDYSTQHPRATAESAFSTRHTAHMTTFLSHLAFWQDVLDHCRSAEVKQSLLDHFQILFLQQLLYPSILQSSDTDAGSSVAVLTYMTAMLESLEYPELLHMMLRYLLAIPADRPARGSSLQNDGSGAGSPPRSPQAVKRRQSLLLLARPKDPDDYVAPELFSLTDLILNSAASSNHQTVFAALRLASVLLIRQKRYSFGTFVKIQSALHSTPTRTIGHLEQEVEQYCNLLDSIGYQTGIEEAYSGLCEDVRLAVESQVPFQSPIDGPSVNTEAAGANRFELRPGNPLLRSFDGVLATFWSNSVDVNLALTQAIVSLAVCTELHIDEWLASTTSSSSLHRDPIAQPERSWQQYLDNEELDGWSALQKASQLPQWDAGSAPLLWRTIRALVMELVSVRNSIASFEQLVAGRKNMLQSNGLLDTPSSPMTDRQSSSPGNFRHSLPAGSHLQVPGISRARSSHSRSSSTSSINARGRGVQANALAAASPTSPSSRSSANSPIRAPTTNASSPASAAGIRPSDVASDSIGPVELLGSDGLPPTSSPALTSTGRSIFQPPPPDVPSTTDVLMQTIIFPPVRTSGNPEDTSDGDDKAARGRQKERKVSLNHVLTNVIVLQEFIMELVAVLQVRAAVLGEKEIKFR